MPLSPGRAERHGFEYYRHGTLSLYAALETASGEVLGKTASRPTSAEFVAFLRELVAGVEQGKEVHLIADNLSAHKIKAVAAFLEANPRVSIHYTPTYSSWLNQVEIWFSKIQRDIVSRGIFSSKSDIRSKILRYIRHYNKSAVPFNGPTETPPTESDEVFTFIRNTALGVAIKAQASTADAQPAYRLGTLKIGIYSELFEGSALGGREFIVAVLAEEMSRRGHLVEYLHHQRGLSVEGFAAQLGIPPECLALRCIGTRPAATLRDFRRRRAKRKAWDLALSEPFDLFVNIVHGNPAICYADRGVLMVLFPFFEPYNLWAGRHVAGKGKSVLWLLLRNLHLRWQWQRCMASYQLKTSISTYSQLWTRRRWKVESTVVYPPTESFSPAASKENAILSIGRFSGFRVAGLSKRQLEMMRSFIDLAEPGWEYNSVGAVGAWEQDRNYYQEVHALAASAGGKAQAIPNIARDALQQSLQRAKIFWHAAGFGDDDQKHPELMEHFGIATVDAMAAGCVPVVIRRGAQPEIVEHGISGFLWDTLDELKSQTRLLMQDEALRISMAEAAKERAKHFSRDAFIQRFREFLRPLFQQNPAHGEKQDAPLELPL